MNWELTSPTVCAWYLVELKSRDVSAQVGPLRLETSHSRWQVGGEGRGWG